MTRQLVVRPQAAAELIEAQQWFESQRPGLGQEFALEVDLTISEVIARPESFPHVHGATRRAIVHRFPFGVFFRVAANTTIILGVLHGRRDPQTWQRRR